MEENKSIVKKDVGTQVLDRINALCETGLKLPADYSATNAIKASMLNLMEAKDKNGAPALQVCTQSSVQSALFEMATKGLDVSKKQAYFIVRGNKLCLHVSYFGNILQVKRLYPDWEPVANTIREGDEFVYTIDPATGKKKLVKHEQKIENLDNALIGAYTYLPSKTGDNELYVMTKKQILTAWSKSPNKNLSTHKEFDEKMALKTILNSGCQKVINATPQAEQFADDDDDFDNNEDPIKGGKESEPFVEFEEVDSDIPDTPDTDTDSVNTTNAASTVSESEQQEIKLDNDEF